MMKSQISAFSLLIPLSAAAVDYSQVESIFAKNCLECHGPDKDRSALRIDQRPNLLVGGDSGLAAIVPGDAAGSFLIDCIKGIDPDMQMPPKGDPLTKEEIALIETWINEGANWPGQMDAEFERTSDLWSLQPVEKPDVPDNGASSEVDAFLTQKLAEKNLGFSAAADPLSLIRRASVTLTGFQPTPERTADFVAAFEKDADAAYEALIDELLASPHFGERWAQHWLDVIRWAETNGSESNLYRKNAWIYRDYVTRAFNEDTPYDQFIREQLAGDQLGVGEATGFLVAGPHVPAATVGREPSAIRQARADRMDEIMQTVGASLLGMTVSCARCHNHKFDPITIQDYYSLTAIFQGVEFGGRYPEFAEDHPRKQRAKEIWREVAQLRKKIRDQFGVIDENWGGYREIHFKPQETTAVRLRFDWKSVRIDEMNIYGPEEYNCDFTRPSEGAKLSEDPDLNKPGNPLERVNDGQIGTMAWAANGKDNKKPWIVIEFPETRNVNRIKLSNNREYYFETDYLSQANDKGFNGEFRIDVRDENGEWKPLISTQNAKKRLEGSAEMTAVSEELHQTIYKLMEEGPRTSFVGKFMKPETTRVLHRGSPENPKDEVPPAGFAILEGDLGLNSETPDRKRRMEFANWLLRPEHPLTSRVMVNRIWHHIFGAGIVPTTSDFGEAGARPTHPQLLDWLAAEFVETDKWSMKAMIRRLVMTEAFRQSSLPNDAGLERDAGAMLLWRFPPRRVEAEVIRDSILQASGKLDPTIGGRSYRIHNVKKTYAQWEVVDNHGEETWRRMLYQERMRRVDDRIFTAFDFPDCGQVRARRPVSTTPLQALNLMNSDFAIQQSKFIAERAGNVERCFELLLSRKPTPDELEACKGVELSLVARTLINSNEFAFLP